MPVTHLPLSQLSNADRRLVENWLADFDLSWEEGKLAARAQALPPNSGLRVTALAEMVKIDLERQWQQGRRPQIESYLDRYPELGSAATVAPDLIQAEYEVRRQFHDTVDLADFHRRFPGQAEGLRQLLDEANSSQSPRGSTCEVLVPSTASSVPDSSPVSLAEQFGRYRILKELGRGGMGSVFLAHDTQLDRRVALKVPHFTATDGPDALERFYREARAAAVLEHPNLCAVFDVGTIDGTHFLTMAYVEGESLQQRLRSAKLTPRDAARLVQQIAEGVAEAHRHSIVHRDLKPSNVMLNRRGEPVVMDFGLARRVNASDVRLTQSGSLLGTPAYMSPEQAAGESAKLGPACDIYSLGVLLYEMLTGRIPFQGGLGEVLVQVLTVEPARPSTLRPGIDARLESICLKAMAKKPDDRFLSMSDFAAALGEYLRQSQSTAVKPQRRWLPWLPPATVAAGLVATMLALRGTEDPRLEEHGKNGVQPRPTQPVAAERRPTLPNPVEGPAGALTVLNATAPVNSVSFTDKPNRIVSAGEDKTIRFWDLDTKQEQEKLRQTYRLLEYPAFAPDGQRMYGKSMASIQVTDLMTEKVLRGLNGIIHQTSPAAFAANGNRVVLGRLGTGNDGSALAWDLETGERVHFKEHKDDIRCVALSPDGKRALSASKDGVYIWEFDSGKQIARLPRNAVVSAAFTPDGKQVVTGEVLGALILWDIESGNEMRRFQGHKSAVTALVMSADGERLLSGSDDKTVRTWDVKSGKPLLCGEGHTAEVTCVALSTDGKRALSGSKDQTIRLWNLVGQAKDN